MSEYEFNFMLLCLFFSVLGFCLGYLFYCEYDRKNCMDCKHRFCPHCMRHGDDKY